MFVTSDKQAGSIPEELFDGAADQSIATVNFSKNQLTSVPPRYTHTPSLSFCLTHTHTEHHCVTDGKAPTKSHFNADDCRLITLLSAGWWNSNLRCQKSIWVSIDWSAVHPTSASYSSLHTSISGTQTQPTLRYGQNLFQEAPIYYIMCKFWVQSTERTKIHRIIHVCVFVCSFAFILFFPFQIRHHIIANHCQHFSSGVSRPVLFKLSYNLTLHNNGCCF